MDSTCSYRANMAREVVRQKLAAELNKIPSLPHIPHSLLSFSDSNEPGGLWAPHHLPHCPALTPDNGTMASDSMPENSKVCIVGAGVAGLYIAMILEDLSIENLSYEILEASDRAGGRLKTHHFTSEQHDYYDIGAMRFPKIPIMKRTFKLFDLLEVPQIPYILDKGSVKTPSRYNDIVVLSDQPLPPDGDPYKVSKANGGSVPDETIRTGLDAILNKAYGRFKDGLKADWKTGFKELMNYDKYSTRQYLQTEMGLDFFSIQWLETTNSASGLFDQAFSESVIDSLDFEPNDDWTCILGGTSLVSDAMQKKLKEKVQFKKRVSKISIDHKISKDSEGNVKPNMFVTCAGEKETRDPYVTVFNTTSLACLQRIDLTDLDLHPSQKDAIRSLHYDDSAKVAIKFKRPWWIQDCGITAGGVASTDLPLRTCVYPSYNLKDSSTAVLLCSYTWSQDATRVGSLISGKLPEDEIELKDLMIDNLAKLHQHSFGNKNLGQIRAIIGEAYHTHHAFSWSHDPYTSGAFALVSTDL